MFIDQCSTRVATGVRDAALITVPYRSGLRISEALAPSAQDLNGGAHKLRTVGTNATAFGLIDR